jgi:hypothetical protein
MEFGICKQTASCDYVSVDYITCEGKWLVEELLETHLIPVLLAVETSINQCKIKTAFLFYSNPGELFEKG